MSEISSYKKGETWMLSNIVADIISTPYYTKAILKIEATEVYPLLLL